MNISAFFKKHWVHFAAVGIFLVVCLAYFSLQMKGYSLKQHDIEQHIGSAHEIQDFREHNDGAEPLWTNSMFGGMPATQISVIYSGNIFSAIIVGYFKVFQGPFGVVLLYMLCAYAGLLMMRVNKWVALFGALSYGFLSYNLIIVQAGHNSKAVAVAFMLPVVGAFIMAMRRHWLAGSILASLFMSFEISSNHLQVTYYLGILLLGLGISELYLAIRQQRIGNFLKATSGIIFGFGLAVLINYGNIFSTTDYAKHTIRGGNDLTINADGSSNAGNSTEGLDRDYITQYSYGKGESFTLISPYVKGGGSMAFENSPFVEVVEKSDIDESQMQSVLQQTNAYWGDQPVVSGPVYLGVILVFLCLLGMIYIKDPSKWALLAVAVLTLLLSWGKNYMGLTNWFLDNVPGYDKFRAVTIILVIVELCIPLIAILFLDKLMKEREAIKGNIKPFYIASAVFMVLLIGVRMVGIDDVYLSSAERSPSIRMQQEQAVMQQLRNEDPKVLAENGIDINNPAHIQSIVDNQMTQFESKMDAVQTVRENVFKSSMTRSILFSLLAIGILFIILKTSISNVLGIALIGVFSFIDIVLVTRNYLNNDDEGSGYKYWAPKLEVAYPMNPEIGDQQIMDAEIAMNSTLEEKVKQGAAEGRAKAGELGADGADAKRIETAYAYAALNRNTNYRVYDLSGGFSSARASFFHKSLGGYHGAKLRSIQNLADFHLNKSNNKVFNMLNVKYFLQPTQEGLAANENNEALGNAWFVKRVKVKATPNDEILALGAQFRIKNVGTGKFLVNGTEKKELTGYGNEKLQYLVPGEPDTLDVPLSNGIPLGVDVVFVRDINGKTDLVMKQGIASDTTKSFTQFVEFRVTEDFDPKTDAIIGAKEKSKLSASEYSGEGTIKMVSYAPNKIVYKSKSNAKQLAVFSEIYYPDGWTATVNGKPAEIVRVNYLLRGIELPKGDYTIEFKYADKNFEKYNKFSLISSLLLIIASAAGLFLWYRKNRKDASLQA